MHDKHTHVARLSLTLFCSWFGISAIAQVGGQNSFEFMNMAANARLAGLGGVNVSLTDQDVNFFFSNPVLVGDTLTGWASSNYLFYVADIGQASFAYSHSFKKIGAMNFGVQHIGYGDIHGYDDAGQETGTFKSGETAIIIGKSHQVSSFRIGVNLKVIFSSIAGHRSSALAFDLGGVFIHPEKDLQIGLVIKNFGFVFSEYSSTSKTKLPFDAQFGATYKPEHMPLRFSFTAMNLVKPGEIYDDPNNDEDDPSGLDKVLRHLNAGAEVLLHRNFSVLVGYNYLKHQELKTSNSSGGGISFGLLTAIKSFSVAISRSGFTKGNGVYNFTLAADLNKLILKRKVS